MKYQAFVKYQQIQAFKNYIESEYKGYYVSKRFIYKEFNDNWDKVMGTKNTSIHG